MKQPRRARNIWQEFSEKPPKMNGRKMFPWERTEPFMIHYSLDRGAQKCLATLEKNPSNNYRNASVLSAQFPAIFGYEQFTHTGFTSRNFSRSDRHGNKEKL